jgi:hypothetical protein
MNTITKEDLQELGVSFTPDEANVQKVNDLLSERIGLAVASELDEAGLQELKSAVAEGKNLMEFAREKVVNLDQIIADETDIFLADLAGGRIIL